MLLRFRTDRPGQTMQTQIRLLRVYTVCHFVCIFCTHYSMVKPHSSNFRIIAAIFWVSEILGFLRVAVFCLVSSLNLVAFKIAPNDKWQLNRLKSEKNIGHNSGFSRQTNFSRIKFQHSRITNSPLSMLCNLTIQFYSVVIYVNLSKKRPKGPRTLSSKNGPL